MTDPLSLGAATAGFVSLGLAVTQGLLKYYRPFKRFYKDVEEFTDRIESFNTTLARLNNFFIETRIPSTPSIDSIAALVCRDMQRCKDKLRELENLLEKCEGEKSAKPSRIHKMQTRALYPFRHRTLDDHMAIVKEIKDDLNTSLVMLSTAITVAAPSTPSASATADAANRPIQDGNRDSHEQRLKTMEDILFSHGLGLLLSPSMLRSALDSMKILDGDTDRRAHPPSSRRRVTRRSCSCTVENPFPVTPGCVIHNQHNGTSYLWKRKAVCKWLLGFSVRVSLGFTRGAGGLSISPSLEFRGVVPENSPGFARLFRAQKGVLSVNASPCIQTLQRELLELLRQGKASPSDTLPNGNTMLHVITRWQKYNHGWNSSSWLSWRTLIKSLLQAGLLPDRVNDRGITPADNLIGSWDSIFGRREQKISEDVTVNICADLLDAGGYMSFSSLCLKRLPAPYAPQEDGLFGGSQFRLIWRIDYEKGLRDIETPEPLEPLIDKSTRLLHSLLERGVDMKPWVDYYIAWPTGLAKILEMGVTPGTESLLIACEANCEESVRILVENHQSYLGERVLEMACYHSTQEIVDLILRALVDRRKRLQDLAKAHLPEDVICELGLRSDHLPNLKSHRIYQFLEASTCNIDIPIEQEAWSVYDCIGVDLKLANRLWELGFHNVREVDDNNETCLTKLCRKAPAFGPNSFLDFANWLVVKGADQDHQTSGSPDLPFTIGQYISAHVNRTRNIVGLTGELRRFSDGSKSLLRKVFFNTTRDTCCCPCSTNGCSSFTRILSGIFSGGIIPGEWDLTSQLVTLVSCLVRSMDPNSQERFLSQTAADIIRHITFQSLHITHTCMHGDHQIDPDDITEIHDEERILIAQLDDLMTEFLPLSREAIRSFPDFLRDQWMTRINEVLSCKTPSAEEMQDIRETGVVLDL